MLKNSSSFVLGSLRGSTVKRRLSSGIYPFTKIHQKGERITRSAVCTFLTSSLPAALHVERRVLARRGREGEIRGPV